VWEKLRKDNHFLDCRVYARSAAAMLQIDRMSNEDWDELDLIYTGEVEKKAEPEQLRVEPVDHSNKRKSTWIKK
jgi:phage terminase large subunit GpA-like protein